MSLTMAKPRPKPDPTPDPGRPKVNRTGLPLNLYIDPALRRALKQFVDDSDPRVGTTAVVESALQQWLKSRGYWPPVPNQP